MKRYLFLIAICFSLSLNAQHPEIKPYVDFLKTQNTSVKDQHDSIKIEHGYLHNCNKCSGKPLIFLQGYFFDVYATVANLKDNKFLFTQP